MADKKQPIHESERKKANETSEDTFDSQKNAPSIGNDVATNDGSIIETLDTTFHHKPGVAEGNNPSGSDRADYYEARSYGKSDAEEELDALNNNQPEGTP